MNSHICPVGHWPFLVQSCSDPAGQLDWQDVTPPPERQHTSVPAQDPAVQGAPVAALLLLPEPGDAAEVELDVSLAAQQTKVTPPSTVASQHVSPAAQATPPQEAPEDCPPPWDPVPDVDEDSDVVLSDDVLPPNGAFTLAPQPTASTAATAAAAVANA